MTPAEKELWKHLCNRQLDGWQFRRQHAVGHYVVDFFCAKAKLVIEVDGDIHSDEGRAEYDAKRTEWLNDQKRYCVIRFWNNDALYNIDSVLAKILEALNESHVDLLLTNG